MRGRNFQLFKHFVSLMLAAGLLFFMAAALTEPFKKIVLVMNDGHVGKTPKDWALFVLLSAWVGSMWAGLWLWFKGSEKKFLEVWFAKAPQQGIQPDGST